MENNFFNIDGLKERGITPFFYWYGFSLSGIHLIFASIHQMMVDVMNCDANLKMMKVVKKEMPMAF